MLVLTRKKEESIRIGSDIIIKIIDVEGRQVKLAIDAPKNMPVYREEIYYRIMHENTTASNTAGQASDLLQIAQRFKNHAQTGGAS